MGSFEKLKEAKQMLDAELITDEEFQQLKARFLKEMDEEKPSSESSSSVSEYSSEADPGALVGIARPAGVSRYSSEAGHVTTAQVDTSAEENASSGMIALSFFIPLAGFIMFFMDRDKKPKAAKQELIAAGIGFVLGSIALYAIGYEMWWW